MLILRCEKKLELRIACHIEWSRVKGPNVVFRVWTAITPAERDDAHIDLVHPLGARSLYKNWGCELAADEVTEKFSGKSWGKNLRERIQDPLGMHGTTTNHSPTTPDGAKAYMALSDGTCTPSTETKTRGRKVTRRCCWRAEQCQRSVGILQEYYERCQGTRPWLA